MSLKNILLPGAGLAMFGAGFSVGMYFWPFLILAVIGFGTVVYWAWGAVRGGRDTARRFLPALLVALLCGCSNPLYEKIQFYNDGQSTQVFNRDDYECERDADLRTREPVTAGGYGALSQAADRFSARMSREERRREIYLSCMKARGYRPREA